MAEKVKKTIPWFLVLALIGLAIGIGLNFESTKTEAGTTVSTSVNVGNDAPGTLTNEAESPASSVTSPTNVGFSVTFGATGNDPNSESYWLLICSTNNYSTSTPGTNPPSCYAGATKWCISSLTGDESPTSCSTTTQDSWAESNAWYAFACDNNSVDQKCSPKADNQGSADGGSESPFYVNHRPTFNCITEESGNPGATNLTVNVTSTDCLNDTDTGDLVKFFVCKANDFTGTACGGGGTWCVTDLGVPNATSCDLTVPSPASHGATAQSAYYPFTIDGHNSTSTGGVHGALQYYSVNDIAPTVESVSLHNDIDITIPIKPNTVIVTTTSAVVRDYNGCDDIVSATSTIYISSYGNWGSCASSSLDCYNLGTTECGKSACDGIGTDLTATYTCTTSMQHWTNPTDASTGNLNAAYHWISMITALDGGPYYGWATSTVAIETGTQTALDVSEASIAYGNIGLGQNTGSTNSTTTVVNYGNSPLDTKIYANPTLRIGSSWANILATSSQAYGLNPFNYSVGGNDAVLHDSATATTTDIVCAKPTSITDIFDKVSWGLGVDPSATVGVYAGTDVFSAILDSAPNWP